MSERAWTRREALRCLFRPQTPPQATATETTEAPEERQELQATVALIQGRLCLAYRKLSCSVCAERCPEPGAIVRERGIPRVDPLVCTGCTICHEVCPAPQNAILKIPRGRIAAPLDWSRTRHGT